MQESEANGWSLIHPRIMSAKDLVPNQKLLWGRVASLSDVKGYCWASNAYLANEIGVSVDTARQHLYDMRDKGYITIDSSGDERRITPLPIEGGVENSTGGVENSTGGGVENSTRSMYTPVTNGLPSDNLIDLEDIFEFWADRLREITGRKLRPRFDRESRRVKQVNARLAEGYTVEDIKKAILGCTSNPHNIKGGHYDLELICRNTKIAQYIAWYENDHYPDKPKAKQPRALELEEFTW